jgi:hypothetical protein
MWIPQTEPQYAVPDWYTEDGLAHFGIATVQPEWFPRRPGIAGDFGLALDMLKKDSAANGVHTTVCSSSSLYFLLCALIFYHRGHTLLAPLPPQMLLPISHMT